MTMCRYCKSLDDSTLKIAGSDSEASECSPSPISRRQTKRVAFLLNFDYIRLDRALARIPPRDLAARV